MAERVPAGYHKRFDSRVAFSIFSPFPAGIPANLQKSASRFLMAMSPRANSLAY